MLYLFQPRLLITIPLDENLSYVKKSTGSKFWTNHNLILKFGLAFISKVFSDGFFPSKNLICFLSQFVCHKFLKIENYFGFEVMKKKSLGQFSKNYRITNLISADKNSKRSIYCTALFRIRIGSGLNRVSGSWSRRAKMTHESRKKLRNFMFWSAGCSLLRAEGLLLYLSWKSFMEA